MMMMTTVGMRRPEVTFTSWETDRHDEADGDEDADGDEETLGDEALSLQRIRAGGLELPMTPTEPHPKL